MVLFQVTPVTGSTDKLDLNIIDDLNGEKKKTTLFNKKYSAENKEKLMNGLIFVGHTVIPVLIAGFTSGYFISGTVIRDNEYTKT